MADTESKPNSHSAWKKELPSKYLADENIWNDDDFMPRGALTVHRDIFRSYYAEYFRQICQSDGFDFDIYPGDAKAAIYKPYLEFENENDLLWKLANHAMQDYNKKFSIYKLEVSSIQKVNVIMTEYREFLMTIYVSNADLPSAIETFQIHAYQRPDGENIVLVCRKKMLADLN